MSLFRSDRMGYYSLVMPGEYAWEVINELGELECLQFVDLNASEATFNRPYSNYVRRCEELEIKIDRLKVEMRRFETPINPCHDPQEFIRDLKIFLLSRNKAEKTYFNDLETFIEEKTVQLIDHIKSYDSLIENYNHLIEWKQVLLQTRPYIGDSEFRAHNVGDGGDARGGDLLSRGNIRFSYLAGVIDREDSLRFKKILFRVTRGMAWTALIDITKPKEDDESSTFKEGTSTTVKDKTVFLIVYQGGSYDMMKGKLNKICESFSASRYGIPEEPQAFQKKLDEIEIQLREAQNVINITQTNIKESLAYFSRPRTPELTYSLIEDIRLFILKEKAVYHNLNFLQTKNVLYQGNCWCPKDISDKVRTAVTELKRRKPEIGGCDFKELPFPARANGPTHFRMNEVTWVFQEIVNTYGIPRYREINPGLFTIATFPFLFGVMFGDIGHGGLLLAFACYLIFYKEQIEKDRKSLLRGLLPVRYLLVLNGLFATYVGFVYNDFMAMPWNLFGSCYDHSKTGIEIAPGKGIPRTDSNCVYAFGVDPGWYGVPNELTFINSLKMKLSVILGVSQMLFGLLLRGANNFHFDNWIELIFEFIPMVIFLVLTFGYMSVLMFFKWLIPWGTPEYPIGKSPSIITIFIKMVLSPGEWSSDIGLPLFGDMEGKAQAQLQLYFLIVAAICAVLILIPKPIILWIKSLSGPKAPAGYTAHQDEAGLQDKLLQEENAPQRNPEQHVDPSGHGDHFEFGEVFVHQIIETIEFVLGSISNTASYLRLWALSLAHSQLAKVFYDNTIGAGIVSGNFLVIFLGFPFFAMITFGVIMCMDFMECFLHALRLHWVEFQNKFFKADGYLFEPLSFQKAISASNEK